MGILGVGGVKLVEFWFPTLKPPALFGVGVIGYEWVGDSRRTALETGRKMPAPAIEVPK